MAHYLSWFFSWYVTCTLWVYSGVCNSVVPLCTEGQDDYLVRPSWMITTIVNVNDPALCFFSHKLFNIQMLRGATNYEAKNTVHEKNAKKTSYYLIMPSPGRLILTRCSLPRKLNAPFPIPQNPQVFPSLRSYLDLANPSINSRSGIIPIHWK